MLIPECPSFSSSEEKKGDYQHKKRSSIDRAFVADSLLLLYIHSQDLTSERYEHRFILFYFISFYKHHGHRIHISHQGKYYQ